MPASRLQNTTASIDNRTSLDGSPWATPISSEPELSLISVFWKLRLELQRQCHVQLNHLLPGPWDDISTHGDTEHGEEAAARCPEPKDRVSKIIRDRLKRVQSKENIDALTQEFRRRILVNKRSLKDSLEPNVVAKELVARNILTDAESDKILKPKKKDDRIYCLIGVLQQKDFGAISDFVDVLKNSGYKHLANVIRSTYTDCSGQPSIRDISMKIHILDDEILKDVPSALRKVFHKNTRLMKELHKRYGLVTSTPPSPDCPLTLSFHKSKNYDAEILTRDLLNLEVAALFREHLYADEYTGHEKVILDVDLSDLVLSADVDYCVRRQRLRSSTSTDSISELCECDGDGSCIIPLIANREEGRRHHETVTKNWHERLIDMTTKHSIVKGQKRYVATASDIRHAVLQQRHEVSISIIRTQSPITVLHHAIIEGRLDVVRVLFECGILNQLSDCTVTQRTSPNLNKTPSEIADLPQHNGIKERLRQILEEEQKLPWLHRCARIGDIDGARVLIERHPDQLQKTDSKGGLPLYWAIMGGCVDLVKLILSETISNSALDIGRMDRGGTALCLAASVCRADLVPILVLHGANPDSSGTGRRAPLEYAIEEKDVNTIHALLDAGASLPVDALCQSVNTGHVATFEAILDEEADVDKLDNTGMSALLYAAQGGHIKILNTLIEMGADIRCVNKQLRNVFHMAVESGSVGVLQRMVHEGRTQHCIRELINSRDRYLGRERCFLVRGRDQGAAAFHYIECHRWLISAFSDTTKAGGTVDVAHFGVPIVSGWGISPSPQDVERVDHHYDVNKVDARTPEDLTPLNLLALSWTATKPTKMAEILVQALVSEGLSLDISDCFGLTPMHMAAMRGNMDMVRLLLRNNVNYGLKSLQDHQAIEVAELNNHVSVVNYIKSHDVINGESLRGFVRDLKAVNDAFETQQLATLQESGASIEKHIIETIRPLEDSMKRLLFAMGTSTIQPEMETSSVRTETSHETAGAN